MRRINTLEHRGARVLEVDFSSLSEVEEIKRLLADAAERVREGGSEGMLVLIDLRGVPYNLRIVRMLGEAAASNRRFVRARAVVGLPPIAEFAAAEIVRFSERPASFFDTREEALAWLLEQAGDAAEPNAEEGGIR